MSKLRRLTDPEAQLARDQLRNVAAIRNRIDGMERFIEDQRMQLREAEATTAKLARAMDARAGGFTESKRGVLYLSRETE